MLSSDCTRPTALGKDRIQYKAPKRKTCWAIALYWQIMDSPDTVYTCIYTRTYKYIHFLYMHMATYVFMPLFCVGMCFLPTLVASSHQQSMFGPIHSQSGHKWANINYFDTSCTLLDIRPQLQINYCNRCIYSLHDFKPNSKYSWPRWYSGNNKIVTLASTSKRMWPYTEI